MHYTNFILEGTPEYRITDYFGEEPYCFFDFNAKLEDIVVAFGSFRSKTEARKNNWCGSIPFGFTEWVIGKRKFYTFIPVYSELSCEINEINEVCE